MAGGLLKEQLIALFSYTHQCNSLPNTARTRLGLRCASAKTGEAGVGCTPINELLESGQVVGNVVLLASELW
jgi:hypothetical protein